MRPCATPPRRRACRPDSSVLDLGYWSYTTVVVDASERFAPVVSDPESIELRWVPVGAVDALPLHPRFAESWPALRARL